jgi:hypothetical protein
MTDIEIPLGKRTKAYRFFEMLPALLSYGSIILLVVLSLVSPLLAAAYLLAIIITTLVKAFGIAYHTTTGRSRLEAAQHINWHERLEQLENPASHLESANTSGHHGFGYATHLMNLQDIASQSELYPLPSEIYNAAIIATYNESYEILQPTIQSLIDSSYDLSHLIVTIAYEQRGGKATYETVHRLKEEFGSRFKAFLLVEHPADLPHEVIGKGGNITFGARALQSWLIDNNIKYNDVIVTTLDSDNRVHRTYFDYLTYEYIVHPDRKHLSYQPICLFINNIWDVPAPMRVVATGNSFWNIISSMRPHTLRNFASHSQPMDALVEMDFWSTRTIVEDGHQYWRSYFHFKGQYGVVAIYVPIYQDAVMSSTYAKTLKAQFIQLRRWAYGASDVPYVATHIFTKQREVPIGAGLARLVRLIDSHVTLASIAILIAVGGWVPLFVNGEAAHSIAAHQLPEVISRVQQVALVGLFITIFFAFKLLPPRPLRYKRSRNIWMVLQWVLMPVTAVVYSSASAFTSQTALLLGRYFDKFDVTDKATVKDKK